MEKEFSVNNAPLTDLQPDKLKETKELRNKSPVMHFEVSSKSQLISQEVVMLGEKEYLGTKHKDDQKGTFVCSYVYVAEV